MLYNAIQTVSFSMVVSDLLTVGERLEVATVLQQWSARGHLGGRPGIATMVNIEAAD